MLEYLFGFLTPLINSSSDELLEPNALFQRVTLICGGTTLLSIEDAIFDDKRFLSLNDLKVSNHLIQTISPEFC
jgi:hypothetical protein